jgi:hypothetical protein
MKRIAARWRLHLLAVPFVALLICPIRLESQSRHPGLEVDFGIGGIALQENRRTRTDALGQLQVGYRGCVLRCAQRASIALEPSIGAGISTLGGASLARAESYADGYLMLGVRASVQLSRNLTIAAGPALLGRVATERHDASAVADSVTINRWGGARGSWNAELVAHCLVRLPEALVVGVRSGSLQYTAQEVGGRTTTIPPIPIKLSSAYVAVRIRALRSGCR